MENHFFFQYQIFNSKSWTSLNFYEICCNTAYNSFKSQIRYLKLQVHVTNRRQTWCYLHHSHAAYMVAFPTEPPGRWIGLWRQWFPFSAGAELRSEHLPWFSYHIITVLDWPSHLPDLSLMENLWFIVKGKIRDTRPKNTGKAANLGLTNTSAASQADCLYAKPQPCSNSQ